MAIISCSECSNSVSDQAESCPHCGAPIAARAESRGSGTHLTTTQGTSKRLKAQSLLAIALIVVGLPIFMAAESENPDSGPRMAGSLMFTVGFIWFVVTRIRIWWHHG